MLQPSSSGVMHAYVKERARDGTGTAAAARARLRTRNARTGTHGTGCACRSFHELVALRRFAERQRVRRAIRRVTCRKTRSSEPSPVFLNTTLSRERPQTLATRPARQAPIRCPRARTQLRALYLNPLFPFIRRPRGPRTGTGRKKTRIVPLWSRTSSKQNNNKSFRPTSPGVARFFCNVIS